MAQSRPSHRGSVRLISGMVSRSRMSFYLNDPRILSGGFLRYDRGHNLIEDMCPL